MDDKNFVFITQPLSQKEEKEFSAFLTLKKAKAKMQTLKKAVREGSDSGITKNFNPKEHLLKLKSAKNKQLPANQ